MVTRGDPSKPVVSLSLGLSADFEFKRGYGKKQKSRTIRLESGDAFCFGGKSRDILHGVTKIHPPADHEAQMQFQELVSSAEESLLIRGLRGLTTPGTSPELQFRLNLNFRQF